jgi:myosin protein heavy chain
VKKFEKMKRDLDKVQADFTSLAKERNDAVSQLSQEMKEIQRLEAERVDLFARIDGYERQKSERKDNVDMSKSMGDLNLKLKMEIGQAKAENEKLSKEKQEASDRWVQTKASLKEAEAELKSTKSKFSEASESCTNLKNLLEATQAELKKARDEAMESKMEATRTMKEVVIKSDDKSKMSKELDRIDKERKEGLQKIQSMHGEIRDLKAKLSEFEANKAKETKKLQDSLTESLKSNKKVQDSLDSERSKIRSLEESKATMEAEVAAFKKEKTKVEAEAKNLANILEKKKKAENELEAMIKDLKDKLDKYENDKKNALKGEKNKREAVNAKFEAEKKDLEEKLEKMKIQFEKAAIESRKAMTRLEEENSSAKQFVADAQVRAIQSCFKFEF